MSNRKIKKIPAEDKSMLPLVGKDDLRKAKLLVRSVFAYKRHQTKPPKVGENLFRFRYDVLYIDQKGKIRHVVQWFDRPLSLGKRIN